jgi:hypothetical protein
MSGERLSPERLAELRTAATTGRYVGELVAIEDLRDALAELDTRTVERDEARAALRIEQELHGASRFGWEAALADLARANARIAQLEAQLRAYGQEPC